MKTLMIAVVVVLVVMVLVILTAVSLANTSDKYLTWQDKSKLILAFAFAQISVGAAFLIKGFWDLTLKDSSIIYQLGIIPLVVLVFFLISLSFIFLAAYKKKGFDNLKKFSEVGIRRELFFGLLVGLTFGLVAWSVSGSITWFVNWTIFWFLIGLISGREKEFKKELNQK